MSKLLKCLNIILILVMSLTAQANSNLSSFSHKTDPLNCDASSVFSTQLDDMGLALSTTACDAHLQRKLRDYLDRGSHSTMYRATEAAVIMLKGLYRQFGDWHLALAAYNCGPGRIRRAIRAARGHSSYSKVKRFLPAETQKYVAAYVAAAYTITYHEEYGLTPADHMMEDSIASLVVYRPLNLRRLANACDIPVNMVRKMNPSYVRGYIPRNKKGYRLRVPLLSKWAAQEYIWGRPNLVVLAVEPELELAAQFVEGFGFNASQWFFGCKSGSLLHERGGGEGWAKFRPRPSRSSFMAVVRGGD